MHSKPTASEIAEGLQTIDDLLVWKDIPDQVAIRLVDQAIGTLRKQDPDLTTPEGFLEWVLTLALDLRLADRSMLVEATNQLRPLISVNWPGLSQSEVEDALEDVRQLVAAFRARIVASQLPLLEQSAERTIFSAMADHNRRFRLGITPSLTESDLAEQKYLVNSTANFLRQRDGTIVNEFSQRAREIVTQGVKEGLPNRTIANRLEASFGATQSHKYYEIVANQFVSRAQAWGALRSYQEAGIQLAEIMAMMDERTSDICRFLDGKYISVNGSLGMLQGLEEVTDPEKIKEMNPWIHESSDKSYLYIVGPNGEEIRIADVVRSGVGSADDTGEYDNAKNMAELQVLGIGPPPYHANCLVSGTPILTLNGWKDVSEVKIGEKVFTHRGNWKDVKNVLTRGYTGRMMIIESCGVMVGATWDHPFLFGKRWGAANEVIGGEEISKIDAVLSTMQQNLLGVSIKRFREVLLQNLQKHSQRKMGSTPKEFCRDSREKEVFSLRQGLRSLLFSKSHKRKRTILFKGMQSEGSHHCDEGVLSHLRERNDRLSETVGEGKTKILFNDLSQSIAQRCSKTRIFSNWDVRKKQPNVWPFSKTSGQSCMSLEVWKGVLCSEFLRKASRFGVRSIGDRIYLRTTNFSTELWGLFTRFLFAQTKFICRSERVVARAARSETERVYGQRWPDNPLDGELCAGIGTGGVDSFKVVWVRDIDVFNLEVQDDESFVVGGGLISHNCRTTLVPVVP